MLNCPSATVTVQLKAAKIQIQMRSGRNHDQRKNIQAKENACHQHCERSKMSHFLVHKHCQRSKAKPRSIRSRDCNRSANGGGAADRGHRGHITPSSGRGGMFGEATSTAQFALRCASWVCSKRRISASDNKSAAGSSCPQVRQCFCARL